MPNSNQIFGSQSAIQLIYEVTVTTGQVIHATFTFPIGGQVAVIDWGDGMHNQAVMSGVELEHTYISAGIFKVMLSLPKQAKFITEIDLTDNPISGMVWDGFIKRMPTLKKFSNLLTVGYGEVGSVKIAR
jgi:hypothetical protein